MSDRFWPVHSDQQPWFRVGRVDVTTTTFVVGLTVISWLVWVGTATNSKQWLAYTLSGVLNGEVWRLFTWPFAEGLSIWSILTAAMLWYFGNMLEQSIGRRRMAWLFVGIWAALTAASMAVAAVLSLPSALAGIGMIEFAILLLWIAEYPHARFLFNIPAWVFGLIIVAVQVLQMVAYLMWTALLALLLSLFFVAIVARMVGLLTEYPWIPGGRRQRTPNPAKTPRKQARQESRQASDQERMDALLDQISQHGLQSLTPAQRKELKRLSDRRRNG
ncbi:MAG: rhomboid family intramembrane serine protease [Propionicimonas sp.]